MSRPKGFKHSEETRAKMSETQKGRKFTIEHRLALSEGRKRSDRVRGANSYQWIADRKIVAEKLALSKVCYGFIHRAIRLIPSNADEIIQELGWSPRQLKEHLEKQFQDGMTWENHGEWHIDHIQAVANFPKGTPLWKINQLTNLQPLWAKENLRKGARRTH